MGSRKNKFPLNCPFYGHFSNPIGFEQNFIMPMVSLRVRVLKGLRVLELEFQGESVYELGRSRVRLFKG